MRVAATSRTIWVALVTIGALVALTDVARAQEPARWARPPGEPSEAALREARERYVEGTDLAAEGRWADALEAFTVAYERSGVAAALFNVATTLRSLGRHRDARDAFDQLLSGHPEADPEMRADATRLRTEVAVRVALVLIGGVPREPGLELWIDGARRALDDARPVVAEVDPGPHALRLELDRHAPWLWEGTLGDGERLALEADLTPLPERSSRRRPALWATLAVLVVAGLAVGAYFVFFHDRGLEPLSPNTIRL
ncbi:MAG: hypothetical protein KF901_07430 [Myxococcales bacterium]|nr:hypothetical protein [Myxococcales bacterium]